MMNREKTGEILNGTKSYKESGITNFLEITGVSDKFTDQDKAIMKLIEQTTPELNELIDEPTIDSVFELYEKLHNRIEISENATDILFEEKMKLVGRC